MGSAEKKEEEEEEENFTYGNPRGRHNNKARA